MGDGARWKVKGKVKLEVEGEQVSEGERNKKGVREWEILEKYTEHKLHLLNKRKIASRVTNDSMNAPHTRTHAHTCAHTHTHPRAHSHIHAHTHAHTHMYTHMYTHTHMRTHKKWRTHAYLQLSCLMEFMAI